MSIVGSSSLGYPCHCERPSKETSASDGIGSGLESNQSPGKVPRPHTQSHTKCTLQDLHPVKVFH
jgi:hypothetical protein